jgi:uncharacterized protein YggE
MPNPQAPLGDSPVLDRAAARDARAEAFTLLIDWATQQSLRSRAALGAVLEITAENCRDRPAHHVLMTASAILRATQPHDADRRP